MHIEVPSLPPQRLTTFHPKQEETTVAIRGRVIAARERQSARSQHVNAKLSAHEIIEFCKLDTNAQQMLTSALEKLGISARAYHRILKVARTIADLSDSENIQSTHVAEAIQFRKYDRQG
jgi:magnesium chelatase family protein